VSNGLTAVRACSSIQVYSKLTALFWEYNHVKWGRLLFVISFLRIWKIRTERLRRFSAKSTCVGDALGSWFHVSDLNSKLVKLSVVNNALIATRACRSFHLWCRQWIIGLYVNVHLCLNATHQLTRSYTCEFMCQHGFVNICSVWIILYYPIGVSCLCSLHQYSRFQLRYWYDMGLNTALHLEIIMQTVCWRRRKLCWFRIHHVCDWHTYISECKFLITRIRFMAFFMQS